MATKQVRSMTRRRRLVALAALLLSAAGCGEAGVSDEEYSELENRVEFAERELGEVRDRVGALEDAAGAGTED